MWGSAPDGSAKFSEAVGVITSLLVGGFAFHLGNSLGPVAKTRGAIESTCIFIRRLGRGMQNLVRNATLALGYGPLPRQSEGIWTMGLSPRCAKKGPPIYLATVAKWPAHLATIGNFTRCG